MVKVLALQFEPLIGNQVKNYQTVSKMLRENVDFKPDVVILPELFITGLDYDHIPETAQNTIGPISTFLSGIAEKYNTNIIGGSFFEKTHEGKFYNTTLVLNRKGEIISKYRKIHTFSHCGSTEGKFVSNGVDTKIVDIEGIKYALAICYDLRFPEQFRKMAQDGAEIFVVPAAWGAERLEHWILLNRVRALENLCCLVSCGACCNNFAGHSMAVNPWGDIIIQAEDKQTALRITVDVEEIKKIRTNTAFLNDIRALT
ncbi:MAG: hypothetical protein PHX18_02345 [Candidatus Gastranaerophilales bacterium]|nr:hypothetical protein [Candidatus Gastranaerophilales bacterium]